MDLKPEDVVIPETPTKQSGAPQREPRAHKSQEIGFLHFIPDMGDYLSALEEIDLDKNDLRLCFIESPLTNQENAINAFYLYVVYKFIHKHLVISSTTTMAVPSSPGTTSAAPPPPTTTSTTSTSTSTTTPTVPLFHFQCNQGANRSVNVAFIMNILFSNGTDFFDVLQKLSRSSTIQQGMWRTLIPNLVCLSFLFFSSQNKTKQNKQVQFANTTKLSDTRTQVIKLTDKIATLQAENGTIHERLSTLQAENGTIHERLSTIQAENATIQAENATIQAENATIQAENATIRERLAALEGKIQ